MLDLDFDGTAIVDMRGPAGYSSDSRSVPSSRWASQVDERTKLAAALDWTPDWITYPGILKYSNRSAVAQRCKRFEQLIFQKGLPWPFS